MCRAVGPEKTVRCPCLPLLPLRSLSINRSICFLHFCMSLWLKNAYNLVFLKPYKYSPGTIQLFVPSSLIPVTYRWIFEDFLPASCPLPTFSLPTPYLLLFSPDSMERRWKVENADRVVMEDGDVWVVKCK